MSSFTIHFVVPTALIIATGLFSRRRALLLAPFTVFNDFDFIFNFFGYYVLGTELLLHRAIFHNLFIGLPTAILAVLIWRRTMALNPGLCALSLRERWDAFAAQPWAEALVLITFYLESHVFLDMFAGGVTPFYPFWNVYISPQLYVFVNTTTGEPSIIGQVASGEGAPELTLDYLWLSPEEVGILLLFAAAMVLGVLDEMRSHPRRRAERKAREKRRAGRPPDGS